MATTNGCFDLLHVGHLLLLERAKELADVLIVGVNRDRSVRALKGSFRPLQPELDRAQLVAALRPVDYVFLFGTQTPTPYLLKLKPTIHIKGGDYTPEDLVEKEALEAIGTRVLTGPYGKGRSTTALIQKIRALTKAEKK